MLDRSARKTSRTAGWRLAMLACAGILFALPGLAAASDQRLTPIVKAAQKAKPSVVSIRGEKTVLPGPQTGANEAAAARQRHGNRRRDRPAGVYPYELSRGRRRSRNPSHHGRQQEVYCQHRCPRCRDRPGRDQDQSRGKDGRDHARHVLGPHAGRNGGCRRQCLRLRLHGHPTASSAPCTGRCRSTTPNTTTT